MATVATFSISRELGPHPVGQFYSGMRGNPLVSTKPSAIPGAFAQGSPAIAVPTPVGAGGVGVPTQYEHYCLMQLTASVDIVMTAAGADPNAVGLVTQSILVGAGGITSYGVIMRPGDNEIHFRSTT